MKKTAYIILHYQLLEETVACVESIKKNHGSGETEIVVVDNNSANGSGAELKEYYSEDAVVTVLLNEENLGFANGMNTGIHYLNGKSKYDFLVLLNNDTLLDNFGWDEIIEKKYEQYHFAAMGPDVVSEDGLIHSNPFIKQDISEDGLRKMLKQKKKERFLYKSYLKPAWENMKEIVKGFVGYKTKTAYIDEDMLGIQLYGSCLILSSDYLKHYEGLYEKTFLYMEEAVLRHRCEKIGKPCLYTPELVLLHKGSASLKAGLKSKRDRKLFYIKHSEDSCNAFLEDMVKGLE